ncbi:MAG: LPS assembly lipoprotein LptE [Planctomycetaceae bacterium]|jgi:RNase H-fold protein (predicted Holliday junction resolvase)|nr:LPS assembly lipoprotein LptE [Planctomycetaceae bacterium]
MRFLLLVSLLLLSGCSGLGYQVGSQSLFGQDVRTVYVPMVETDPTRRHLAERLTEAIGKEIEERSPYKVVGRPSADSILECRITNKTQRVSLTDNYNDPRQKTNNLVVQVRWRDRRSQDLQQFDVPVWDENATISASDSMVAEAGHSVLTSEQRQIDQIASQIVGMMESPW